MKTPRLVVSRSSEEFARLAAVWIVDRLQRVLAERPVATLALAGGSTPQPVYRRLARPELFAALDWTRVDLYLGDERAVAPDDPASNYAAAAEALGPIAERASIRRIPGEIGARQAAGAYQRLLVERFSGRVPRFDLLLLGIGADGHTASLFPGMSRVESDEESWVISTRSPEPPHERVSLSISVLNEAACVLFLARGADKAHAVAAAVHGREDLPASRVHPERGETWWMLDRAAASELSSEELARCTTESGSGEG